MKQAQNKKQLTKGIVSVAALVIASVLIFIFAGKPIIEWVKDPVAFRAWVKAHGIVGDIAFVGMMVLQVIVAIIPGEPLEIAELERLQAFPCGKIVGQL